MLAVADLLIGAGNPALDFVNTSELRGDPEARDALQEPKDLRAFGRRAGVVDTGNDNNRAELRRAIEGRELLYRLFEARIDSAPPAPGDVDRLADLAAAAYRAASLTQGPSGELVWTWPRNDLASVRHTAIANAVELLHAPSPRLKQCPGDHCGWLFIDQTKRGNRRWCSMEECGQEAKIARRRARAAQTQKD